MDAPHVDENPARTETGQGAPSTGTLTSLIVLGAVVQLFGGVMVALAWPDGGDSMHSGHPGSPVVVALGFGLIGLAGILVLIGAAGWGALLALRIRDAGRGA